MPSFPARPRSVRLATLVLLAATAAARCGGGADATAGPVAPPPRPVASCGITLSTASTAPFTLVTLTGVPASDTLAALLTTSGAAPTTIRVPITRDSLTSQLTFVAPVYPAAPFTGGTVQLAIVGASASSAAPSCAGTSLAIAALDRAPGTSATMLVRLDSLVAAVAASLGSSVDALGDSVRTLPAQLQPVALAAQLFDGPRNPNSLRHVLDGSAPALGGTGAYDPALLDALLRRAGVLDSLAAILTDVQALGAPTAPATALSGMLVPAATRTGPVAGVFFSLDAARAGAPLQPPPLGTAPGTLLGGSGARPLAAALTLAAPFTVTTAEQLDRAMRQQDIRTRVQARVSNLLDVLSNAIGLAGVLPEAIGGAVAAPAAAVGGLVLYGTGILTSGFSALAPQTLQPMQGVAAPRVLAADDLTGGRYGQLTLTAQSAEWRIGLPTGVDGVLSATGPGIGAIAKHAFDRINFVLRLLPNAVARKLAADLIAPVTGTLNSTFGGAIQSGVYVAGPVTYGPVDVSDPKWTTTTLAPAGVVTLGTSGGSGTYVPTGTVGSATVTLATKPQYFLGQASQFAFTVQVGPIGLSVTPASTRARPGGSIQFVAAYTGTSSAPIRWSTSGGTVDQAGLWTAPATEGTYTITATDANRPSIAATGTVQVANVIVVHLQPVQTVDLRPSGTFAFTAQVEGTANQALTWTATRGTVSNTGYYAAPADTGTYVITATSVADPRASATGSVHVRVGGGWTYRFLAPMDYSYTDKQITKVSPSGTYIVGTINNASGKQIALWSNGVFTPVASLPGSTGSAEVIDVNDAGQILGYATIVVSGRAVSHAFLRDANGSITDLVPPGVGAADGTTPVGLNRNGQVLVNTVTGTTGAFYLYDHGTFTLVVTQSDKNPAGASLLNDLGQVIVRKVISQGRFTDYIWQAGALTPVPSGYSPITLNNVGHVLLAPQSGRQYAILANGTITPVPLPPNSAFSGPGFTGLNWLTDNDLLGVTTPRDPTTQSEENFLFIRADGNVALDLRAEFGARVRAGGEARPLWITRTGRVLLSVSDQVGGDVYLLEPATPLVASRQVPLGSVRARARTYGP